MFLDSKVRGSGVVKGIELRLASLCRGRASMAVVVVVVVVVRLLSSEISAGEVARQM
jgi:hypothetical protein